MKKLIVLCQIIFVAFFVIKVLSYVESMQEMPFSSSMAWVFGDQAIAQTPVKPSVPPGRDIKDVAEDALQKERDLLAKLQKKQKELDTRELGLKAEEQKIAALKKEVMDKIDELKVLETQLSEKLKAEKNIR